MSEMTESEGLVGMYIIGQAEVPLQVIDGGEGSVAALFAGRIVTPVSADGQHWLVDLYDWESHKPDGRARVLSIRDLLGVLMFYWEDEWIEHCEGLFAQISENWADEDLADDGPSILVPGGRLDS